MVIRHRRGSTMKRYTVLFALVSCVFLTLAPERAGARSGALSARLPHGMQWDGPGIVRLSRPDHGGFLASYLADLERLEALGVRQLRIDTTCASACTVFLRLGNRVCVTDRARIGFHHIVLWNRATGGPSRFFATERDFNDRFLQSLPAKIRTWHGISGGLPWRMVWLKGEEAAQHIGRCT